MTRELSHFTGGTHASGTSGRFADVFDPSTGVVQERVPLASTPEVGATLFHHVTTDMSWSA